MRNMSFSMTTQQMKDGTKDITRRIGWWNAKPGDRYRAVEKAMGLKKGEKIKELGIIEVISVRKEPLNSITKEDCRREGFPHFEPQDFVQMLVDHLKVKPDVEVNRIEFKRVS